MIEKGRDIMTYELKGGAFPVVVCQLADGEQMVTEKGSMVWMSPNMEMSTSGGGLGKMFSKVFSGESMFQNIYTARGAGMITFGSSFPGRILPLTIQPGQEVILQKAAFLAEVDGELVEYTLDPGQQMVVDTGNVLGFEGGVSIDIQQVKGLKNKLLGGEGFFNTVLTGPGKIWLQTMPISGVASALIPYLPTGGNS